MTKMQKWNAEKGEYEPYSVPEGWDCPLFCADMQRVVNCASCGKEILYGDCYTSQEIHNTMGLGYAVCPECYREEMKRRMERAKAKGEI